MAYLGNSPARSFISFERQVFTIVNSQTVYTLDHSVTNENDIRLVVNNVVQEPGSGKAYTASGTTLTLSAALTNGTDEMYCVYLGRATATEAPGAGSVGTSQLSSDAVTAAKLNDDIISGQTALTSEPATTDELLISDAGTLKRIDYSLISNRPAFEAYLSADQTGITDVTETKVQVDTESFDTDNCYDNSTNYRFTPTVAGKYYVYGRVSIDEAAGNTRNALAYIYKNGSEKARSFVNFHSSLASDGEGASPTVSAVIDFNGSSDYVELYGTHDTVNGGTGKFQGNSSVKYTVFGAYKLIGV